MSTTGSGSEQHCSILIKDKFKTVKAQVVAFQHQEEAKTWGYVYLQILMEQRGEVQEQDFGNLGPGDVPPLSDHHLSGL